MLPPFMMLQRPDNPDGLYILSTSPPYYMGHVWKMPKDDAHRPILVAPAVKVPGYDIYITTDRSLAKVNVTADIYQIEEHLLQRMADFFLSFKIQGQEAKYRKYKDE